MLGVGASAGTPTRIEVRYTLAQVGQPVLLIASVFNAQSGFPVSQGTMSFAVDGAILPGCEAQWVYRTGGAAVCTATFPKVASYSVVFTYSGAETDMEKFDPSTLTAPVDVGKLDPWAYLASEPALPSYGGGLIVNALVLGANNMPDPTGTFTFSEGGNKLVTRPVKADGRAALDLPLTAGNHTIVAVYDGDDLYLPSRPVSRAISVVKGPPTVAISSMPAQIRQPVTITASVRPTGAGGTITFGGVPNCANVPVRDDVANCVYTFNQLGSVDLTAAFSGDSNLTAGSASMKLNVGRVVASVAVAATPNTPVYGQTAIVGALAQGAPGVVPPTGIVTFGDASNPVAASPLDAEGHAQWLPTLAAGVRVVTATYNGDANYGTSQGIATVMVMKANTTTTLALPAGGPFTATVAAVAPGSGAPTGTVRFLRDGIGIGTGGLGRSGNASVATIAAPVGTGNIRAEYTGDLNFNGSVSTVAAMDAVHVDLQLAADRNPAPAGKVTFTVSALANASATPTGTVQLTIDGAAAGSGPLVLGVASLAVDLKPGSHTVRAAYSGDATYPSATASITEVVTGSAGVLTLSANPQAPVYGQPVVLTAQLPAGSTGTVQFADGATSLGSTAGTLTVSRLAAGAHAITASWAGDANWGAASAQVVVTVAKARTATTLAVSGGVVAAQVAAVAPGAGTPTGAVRFLNAATGVAFATVPLESGTASVPLPAGVSVEAASYNGDDNFAASSSGPAGALTAVNAASYDATVFAPDEIVTLFGPNLAGAVSAKLTDSVGVVRGVDLLYASDWQASLVLPRDVATGPATLVMAGMTAPLEVARTAPGLFTADASGHGAPAGQALRVHAGGSQESGPADAIDLGGADETVYLILYGTGLRHFADPVTCTVGGRPAQVVFAGSQGGSPGVDQVNILLPPELKGAGRVDLIVTADGVATNAVTVVLR
jgi:uncharacterized protein (TIGR03437 family)